MHPNSLYHWVQEYEKYGENAFQDMEVLFVMPNSRLKISRKRINYY
ncbi:hypothetical protein [Streptococcus uberis]